MKRRVRSNARSLSVVALVLIATLPLLASPADAGRAQVVGHEPTDQMLQCIRGPFNGMSMESGGFYANNGHRTYKGAYQSDRSFETRYALNLIPPAHWHLWGSHTWDRADKWHPMIQDEMARNALRRTGLSEWPKPSRVCAHLATRIPPRL